MSKELTPKESLLVAYCGKSLNSMTRDELISIIQEMAAREREHFSSENIRARAFGKVALMKRGLV